MQVLSKEEHPTSPSSSNSNITPKSVKDLMQTITKLLEGGQESAQQLKILFRNKRLGFKVEDDDHDHYHVIDHHSGVTLDAFETCLNMLRSYDFDHQEEKTIINKRKVDHVNDVQCSENDHSSKSDDISDAKVSKERRGCYKRRRIGQSWTRTEEATSLMDDGYAWRKYGQKMILNTKYPRSYFRCTHKHDQDCQATKQVQQISENPVKYNIIYHGQHTCKNLHKTPSIVIDNTPLENSSFILSFDTANKYSTPNNNPSLFPQSTFLNSIPTMVNHDHDHHSGPHKQYSSSSTSDNYPPSSSDLTSTGLSSTPVSYDQSDVISQPGIYPSTSTLFDMDGDDLLSLINMEQDNLSQDLDGLF